MSQRRPHIMAVFVPLALVLIGVVVWLGIRGKHDPAAVQVHADFARVLAALDVYRAEHGSIPEEGDLSFLVPKYLPELPQDPWGFQYGYASDGQKAFLQSFGQDGRRGGNGPNQDHTNHDGHAVLMPR